MGRSREGVGHEVLSLVHRVGRAIFSYPSVSVSNVSAVNSIVG